MGSWIAIMAKKGSAVAIPEVVSLHLARALSFSAGGV